MSGAASRSFPDFSVSKVHHPSRSGASDQTGAPVENDAEGLIGDAKRFLGLDEGRRGDERLSLCQVDIGGDKAVIVSSERVAERLTRRLSENHGHEVAAARKATALKSVLLGLLVLQARRGETPLADEAAAHASMDIVRRETRRLLDAR